MLGSLIALLYFFMLLFAIAATGEVGGLEARFGRGGKIQHARLLPLATACLPSRLQCCSSRG